jgi:hypothetical protein
MERDGDHAWTEPAPGQRESVTQATWASAPVLAIDDYAWRTAITSDAAALEAIAAQGANRTLFGLPRSEQDFAERVGRAGFRLAMLCHHGDDVVGAAATTLRNHRSMNLQLVCFFAVDARPQLALATYVRHVFWSLPMHRIFVQLPVVDGASSYIRMLKGAGFKEEGVVRGHALVAGQPADVAVLGVLREEFETWCLENEIRLAL